MSRAHTENIGQALLPSHDVRQALEIAVVLLSSWSDLSPFTSVQHHRLNSSTQVQTGPGPLLHHTLRRDICRAVSFPVTAISQRSLGCPFSYNTSRTDDGNSHLQFSPGKRFKPRTERCGVVFMSDRLRISGRICPFTAYSLCQRLSLNNKNSKGKTTACILGS